MTSSLLIFTPVLAQEIELTVREAFVRSNAACKEVKLSGCASVQTSGVSLGRYITVFQYTPHLVLEANGWSEDMLDEIIPENLFFKVLPS